jgi:hypothetical protein
MRRTYWKSWISFSSYRIMRCIQYLKREVTNWKNKIYSDIEIYLEKGERLKGRKYNHLPELSSTQKHATRSLRTLSYLGYSICMMITLNPNQ